MLFVDLAKAFDSILHNKINEKLMHKLRENKISLKDKLILERYLHLIYNNNKT